MDGVSVKSWVYGIVAGLASFAAPLKVSFLVVLVVIAADFCTGIWASRMSSVSISSRRLRKSIYKMIGYFEVIFLLYVIEKGFDFDLGSYRFIGGFICFVELVSILENTAVISGNKIFLAIVKMLRGKARGTYGEIIDEILKEKNEG